MKHGSLFSGIGGFDLAAEWMGWDNVFHCEWMEFPRKVLDYYWPDADSHVDICKTDFKKYEGTIDIISGGFPCQPFSTAGKRKGTDDERYLWGEMLRAIQEIKPKYVIAENVFGITNIDGGLVFQQVCLDLENKGYEVQPFIIPASAKNAPHQRLRCWFVAYTHGNGFNQCNGNDEINPSQGWEYAQCNIEPSNGNGDASNTKSVRINREAQYENNNQQSGEWRRCNADNISKIQGRHTFTDTTSTGGGENHGQRKSRFNDQESKGNNWTNFPTQSPICGGDDGLPTELDGITFSKWRNESIKAYGNAIVPQVAYQIFKAINNTI